ncbi:MAG: substrate-binding domain-containing protein [Anaerolineae bacterium]|nr:substrate-binding domain-containing protein [Anaerolineae bacterium]
MTDSQQPNARPTIGLLGSTMHRHQTLWLGAVDAAREHHVNLISFLSGPIDPDVVQSNNLYGLASVERLDGLVTWAGSGAGLGTHFDQDEMDAFFAQYRSLPIVNYEKVVDGIPSVFTDTRAAMRVLLAHLIEKHACRRIALIRGPAEHFESQERYQAYIETLAEYGLPFDPDLVCPPTRWGPEAGAEMVRLLLDERKVRPGPDLAVAGTEVEYACGAISVLQARGMHVPSDVAVVGFNDNLRARATMPPVTVMRKPFYESGYKAVEMVLDLLQNKPVPDRMVVPAELIVRRSCGCWPADMQNVVPLSVPLYRQDSCCVLPPGTSSGNVIPRTIASFEWRGQVLSTMAQLTISPELPGKATGWAARLLDALLAELLVESEARSISRRGFLFAVENVLQEISAEREDVSLVHKVLDALHRHAIPHLTNDGHMVSQSQILLQQARIVVDREMQRQELCRRLEIEDQDYVWDDLGNGLMTASDLADLAEAIVAALPRLSISSCYLALYLNPQLYTYPHPAPKWSRLIFAFNGHECLELDGQPFLSHQLVPDGLLSLDDPQILAAIPLHFRQQQLGFALFEAGSRDGQVYRWMGEQISTMLVNERLRQEIAERMRAQDALQQAKEAAEQARRLAETANRAKSAFLAHMSHELRTPLSAILGFSQMLQLDAALPVHQRENVEIINRSGEHLLSLINQVLEMSKIEAGRVTLDTSNFDLYSLLDDLESMFYQSVIEKGLLLEFERASDVPQYIRTDEVKLRQVLINLLGNASKFTDQGGIKVSVKVQNENVPLPPVLADASTLVSTLVFSVSDTGPGIAADELDRVFDAFVQTSTGRQSQQGTGLGMTISRRFAQLMGADLGVRSQVGHGTCFEFVTPIAVVSAEDIRSAESERRVIGLVPEQPHYRILVVDDRWSDRRLIVKLLEPLGFHVREAENEQAAIDLTLAWRPHLVCMDIRMLAMDGYDAARRIKAQLDQAPVIIALTASRFNAERAVMLSTGCDDFLSKPFKPQSLFELLTKYLGVQFAYEETVQGQQHLIQALSLDSFTAIWQKHMRQAAIMGDLTEMMALIEQIRPDYPTQAEIMAQLVSDFEFDRIMDLLPPPTPD